MNLTVSNRPAADPARTTARSLVPVALVAVMAIALLAGGYWYFGSEAERIRRIESDELAAVAELKAAQILQWRHDRVSHVRRSATSPFVRRTLGEWHRAGFGPALRSLWKERLAIELAAGFEDAVLFGADGRILIAAKDPTDPVDPATRRLLLAATSGGVPVLSELYRTRDGRILLDAAAPVLGASGAPLAVLVLRSDARKYLFPILETWPLPSRTAETLLVSRDRDDVVFLNELRHRRDTALTFRLPLGNRTPAAAAVSGARGVLQSEDYRGVPVFAYVTNIPESPWFMVAKRDADELLSEVRGRFVVVALFVASFILTAASLTAFAYRQRQAGLYRDLYRAERERREAHEKARTTLYSIGDGVISTDRDGRVLQMNPVAEALCGWTEAEAQGLPLEDVCRIVNEASRATVENPVQRVLREGRVVGLANHTLLLARDGAERPIADSGAPIHDDSGTVSGVVLVLRDRTEERRVQAALRESEERWQFALEGAGDGVWDWDASTDRVFYSPRWKAMLGYAESDIGDTLGDWERLVHPDDAAAVRAALDRHLQGGASFYRAEYRIRCRDGSYKWIMDRGKILRWTPDGRPLRLIGTHTDISDQKQAEAEHEKLDAQLRQALKMEAVGRLAGGVAHDFNNMLQTILGYADMAYDESPGGSRQREQIEQIRKAAQRSADLTMQLLAFARRQTIAPKILDLNDTIAGMLKMLRPLIGENIDLLWKPARSIWPVNMDPAQLDQVLANLVVNARDAIPNVGTITIETGTADIDKDYAAAHPEFLPGQYVLLAVTDTGCGMDKETLSQIFDPFFTTKPAGQGTGLGLPTVYGIVKQNGGLITVDSAPGLGTAFRIFLPRHAAELAAAEREAPRPEVPTGTETILLVEDEPALLNLGQRLLEQLGYTVLAASLPSQALRLALEHPGDIHVVLSDVVMPELSGADLCQQLVALRPTLKCIFMSGYTSDVIANQGVLDEGVHFLQKPFSKRVLANKLREVVGEPQAGG